MSNGEITGKRIAFLGAVGGFALSLLKLIESGFFLNNIWGINSKTAYFTYVAYIILGVIVAFVFTDRELPKEKIRKNALTYGLLAPSFLLAIVSTPIGQNSSSSDTIEGLPKISNLIVRSAYAGSAPCLKGEIAGPEGPCVKGLEITKKEVEPTIGQALLNALGRGQFHESYLFVVGIARDGAKAEEVKNNINEKILKSRASKELSATIIKPEGGENLFIAIGTFGPKADASEISNKVEALAINTLQKTNDPITKSTAELILRGRVIESQAIFSQK